MNIYELEFDLDSFLDSMRDDCPPRRKIEDHMERRRLREELMWYEHEDPEQDE